MEEEPGGDDHGCEMKQDQAYQTKSKWSEFTSTSCNNGLPHLHDEGSLQQPSRRTRCSSGRKEATEKNSSSSSRTHHGSDGGSSEEEEEERQLLQHTATGNKLVRCYVANAVCLVCARAALLCSSSSSSSSSSCSARGSQLGNYQIK